MSVTSLQRVLRVCNFGTTPAKYSEVFALQEKLAELCRQKKASDTLLHLQHASVYTLGKRGQTAHFKIPQSRIEEQGIDVHKAGRGGETTYHGPGQIILYPVINLRRLGLGARAYVEGLEDCMVAALSQYGIEAKGRVPGRTGVWVENRKIGAIGVKISQGVASHGIGINISTDLSFFDNIVPCGIEDCKVTSAEQELGRHVDITDFGSSLIQQFQKRMRYDNVTSTTPDKFLAPGEMALA